MLFRVAMQSHVEWPGVQPLCWEHLCASKVGLIWSRMTCKHLPWHRKQSQNESKIFCSHIVALRGLPIRTSFCWRSVDKVQECSRLSCLTSPWTTYVCQETLNISGDSLHYWAAQDSNAKGWFRGILETSWASEEIAEAHNKQQWADQIASSGETHLLCGEIKDAFARFRQLRQKRSTMSAPLMSADGIRIGRT